MTSKSDALSEEPYSFERAFNEDAFLQLPLLTWEQFGRKASDRGIHLSFGSTLRDRLEELDSSGALSPVAFVVPGSPGFDEYIFREGTEFKKWHDYPRDESWPQRVLYSPWQFLYLEEAIDLGTAKVSGEWLLSGTRQVSDVWRQWQEMRLEQRAGLDRAWRSLMLLLTALQPRYYPIIRGTLTKITTTVTFDPETGKEVDPYRRAVETFDPEAVIARCGLGPDEVRQLYERVASDGHVHDPLARFFMLVRMLPQSERLKLKGAALLAQDRYDAAEMLRRLYFDLSAELLPAPDDMFDGTGGAWKEQYLGHPPRLGFKPHDLHVELLRHRLYPHSVHLIVEGETDELLIRGLLESLAGPADDLGVTFSMLKGSGRLRPLTTVLKAAGRYARFPVLVLDREGDVERDVEMLKRDGVVSDETVHMWKASLEEDNFTKEEMVRVAKRIASSMGVKLDLTADRLGELYDSQRSRLGGEAKGLATILLDLCRSPDRGPVRISKPQLVDGLRDLLLEELGRDEDEEELFRRRPVMRIVFNIIRAS
jgi:hypothetical protein